KHKGGHRLAFNALLPIAARIRLGSVDVRSSGSPDLFGKPARHRHGTPFRVRNFALAAETCELFGMTCACDRLPGISTNRPPFGKIAEKTCAIFEARSIDKANRFATGGEFCKRQNERRRIEPTLKVAVDPDALLRRVLRIEVAKKIRRQRHVA